VGIKVGFSIEPGSLGSVGNNVEDSVGEGVRGASINAGNKVEIKLGLGDGGNVGSVASVNDGIGVGLGVFWLLDGEVGRGVSANFVGLRVGENDGPIEGENVGLY
jgi:hypothetical protein